METVINLLAWLKLSRFCAEGIFLLPFYTPSNENRRKQAKWVRNREIPQGFPLPDSVLKSQGMLEPATRLWFILLELGFTFSFPRIADFVHA